MRKFLLISLMFMLLFSGCKGKAIQSSSEISLTDIEVITIKALPSPPKAKTIDKKDDIEKVVKFINSINKEKVKQEDIKGWEFWVQTKGKKEHSVTFIGNELNINNNWYKVNSNEIKKFREIYNNLNYKEEPVIK